MCLKSTDERYKILSMKKYLLAVFLISNVTANAQKIIPLYNGKAPGSENWDWKETVITPDPATGRIVMDVANPTLTAFVPANPNGTAVIIAPGGAFHALAFDHEGVEVAKRLNAKGVTAFVLKYRVVHTDPAHPENSIGNLMSTGNFKKLDSINAALIPLALQDGLTAVTYVRQHAAAYKVDPKKIGFMGFSAGGTLTMCVVYNGTDESRPNFVAPIYPYEGAIIGSAVPAVTTPIFLACASDDDLGFAMHSVHIYSKWLEAKQPAELHMYEKGKHGFGTKKQNIPTDSWMDRLCDWMALHGYIK